MRQSVSTGSTIEISLEGKSVYPVIGDIGGTDISVC